MRLAPTRVARDNRRAPVRDADYWGPRLALIPDRYADALWARYTAQEARGNRFAANVGIRDGVSRIVSPQGYTLDAEGSDLESLAERLAAHCRRYPGAVGETCARFGLSDPGQPRATCARWWRRKLRRSTDLAREATEVGIGRVRLGAGLYVSDVSLAVWRESRIRARDYVESVDLWDEKTGETVPLSVAVDASPANPEHRKTELNVRIRGLESYMTRIGSGPGEMWTLTAPSRFHRALIRRKGRKRVAVDNPKWDGSSPRDGHAYLTGLWARIRSALGRAGLTISGLRIAEPHHDGSPHWHILVYGPDTARAWDIFRAYALRDNPDEPGAQKHRVQREIINRAKGSAASYLAKYIAKHVGADGVSDRVKAWASTWRLRQLQFFGAAAVTPYRELRRLKAGCPAGPWAAHWIAADAGDWDAWEVAMGEARLRPAYRQKVGSYGDEVLRVAGVQLAGQVCLTRLRVWRPVSAALGKLALTVRHKILRFSRQHNTRYGGLYAATMENRGRARGFLCPRKGRNEDSGG